MTAVDEAVIAKLESLRNRQTLYEVALASPDGPQFLVCYTQRSGRMMRLAVSKRAERVVATIGNPCAVMLKAGANDMTLDGGWMVRFTGRTEREAIIAGELPRMAS